MTLRRQPLRSWIAHAGVFRSWHWTPGMSRKRMKRRSARRERARARDDIREQENG